MTSHSAYEFFYVDDRGETLKGSNGSYPLTTEEPPVDAFWSVTVYDTGRGGFFHPNQANQANRYHINNTTAVKNADGSVTFTFKQHCETSDQNCLEVPAGAFDYVARYYLPAEAIQTSEGRRGLREGGVSSLIVALFFCAVRQQIRDGTMRELTPAAPSTEPSPSPLTMCPSLPGTLPGNGSRLSAWLPCRRLVTISVCTTPL